MFYCRINDKEHVFLSILEKYTGVEIDVPGRLIASKNVAANLEHRFFLPSKIKVLFSI